MRQLREGVGLLAQALFQLDIFLLDQLRLQDAGLNTPLISHARADDS